jgi:glucans biosynthesis protein
VIKKAQALSKEPFNAHNNNLPEPLRKIGYDEWRDMRFNAAKSLWAGEPFSVQFFHPGFIYQEPVIINYVEKNKTARIPFSADLFDYSQSTNKRLLVDDVGFAGFRVHYPINSLEYADEIVSFLGASYFRALGKNLAYGISARGLAIDTAEPSGEEFPYFREFWIIHPAANAKKISFYALLESESITGAYAFTVSPGEETLVDVRGVLFFRKKIRKLGLAPLTSMFFYSENAGSKPATDFRPEIHDSDGLLIKGVSGEWTWHPLANPKTLLINSFGGGQPLGFGLIQRDTNFDHYQDLEARYDKRPSVWVTPKNNWGSGHLELLQIPTENEYNDNIVAYWVVEEPFEPGDSFDHSYTMAWYNGSRKRSALACVEATRIVAKPESAMFIVDFLLDPLQAPSSGKNISTDIQILNGYKITSSQLIKNTVTNGWRLVIHVDLNQQNFLDKMLPDHKPAMELRAFLKEGNVPITETWSYTYLP